MDSKRTACASVHPLRTGCHYSMFVVKLVSDVVLLIHSSVAGVEQTRARLFCSRASPMKLDGYLRSENVFIDLYIQSFIVLTDSSAWVASEKGKLAPVTGA